MHYSFKSRDLGAKVRSEFEAGFGLVVQHTYTVVAHGAVPFFILESGDLQEFKRGMRDGLGLDASAQRELFP